MEFRFEAGIGIDDLPFELSEAAIKGKFGEPDSKFKRSTFEHGFEYFYQNRGLFVEFSKFGKTITYQIVRPGRIWYEGCNLLGTVNSKLERMFGEAISSRDGAGFVSKKIGISIYHSAFQECPNESPESILVFIENYWDKHN